MMATEGDVFGCTTLELRQLMEHRGREGYEKLKADHGDAIRLCQKLRTSPTEGESLPFTPSPLPPQLKAFFPVTQPFLSSVVYFSHTKWITFGSLRNYIF